MAIDSFCLLLISLFDPSLVINTVTTAIGLGLVIFFHELGHFAVAKWCGVYVERFSIGLGHPILRVKYGETEYAFGWLPFGGYVKMLGQDDMDPGQMVDDQIASNPRAYSAKNVPQRMAIISAGVIMNVITGLLFFALAFRSGVEMQDRTVGYVQVGLPAWEEGIRAGDQITAINGADVVDYSDIRRNTALSRGPLTVQGLHPDNSPFELTITPVRAEITRVMGVGSSLSLELPTAERYGDQALVAYPGTAAAQAGFELGDQVTKVDDQSIQTYLQLSDYMARHAAEPVTLTVERRSATSQAPTQETVHLAPERFRSLGIKLPIGKVSAISRDSVAAQAGIQVGDKIAKVDDLDVDIDVDALRLSEYFSSHAGQPVKILISREVPGGAPVEETITVVPRDVPAWSEPPQHDESPLSIPSLGLAFNLVPSVFSVDPRSSAAAQGIQKSDTIEAIEFSLPTGVAKDHLGDKSLTLTTEKGELNHALWLMQETARNRIVKLTIKPANPKEEPRTVEVQPMEVADWYVPTTRGLFFVPLTMIRKADTFADALPMAWRYTANSITDIYLTLRGLITRDISHKGLSGPIGIAKMAFRSSQAGMSMFIMFLGMISINLAVINFLPIPVLDGGHMVFLLWEGITRNKPSERVQITATWIGVCFLASLMLFVIFQDLFVSKI